MITERKEFAGALGNRLAGRVEQPDGGASVFALFAHCFTCSKDLKAVSRISRALVEQGIGVLRFDFTGLGESEGDFADTNFSSNLEDLLAAVEFLRQEYRAPQLLIGHSLGGAAVLTIAKQIPEAKAVATLGAPSDTGHLHDSLLEQAPELAEQDETQLTLAGRTFRIKRQLLDDLAENRVLAAVSELRLPLLVLHSPVDRVVGIGHARKIYEAAVHPKSFVSLDQADHLLLERVEDARYAAEVLAVWASRYLDLGESKAPPETAKARPESGRVRVSGGATYKQQITSPKHDWIADEPTTLGGTDKGPTPYELLLSALGACTTITLRMYADRKGWPLEEVEVELRHERVHAQDCAECETKTGRLDRIHRELKLTGELTEDQRSRLAEIADRCPVHRTLTSETVISTRLL